MHQKLLVAFFMLFASIGGMLYGYDIGVIAGALLFIKKQIQLTPSATAMIVAAVLGGGSLATLISGPFADWLGRKTMISIAAAIFILGVLIVVTAYSFVMLLIGRLTQGISVGIITIVIPLYLTEAAPTIIRGRCLALFQLFLTAGIMLAYLVNLIFSSSENWRAMFICVLIPAVLLFIGSFIMIESPRWLFNRGHVKRAEQALIKLGGRASAQIELKEMHLLHGKHQPVSLMILLQLLKKPGYLYPFLVTLAIACLNQLTGINSILQYSDLLLKTAGLATNITAIIGTNVVGIINFIGTILAFFLVDQVGRKPLLVFGTLGIILALSITGLVDLLLLPSLLKGIIVLVGLIIYIFSFAIGPGVIVWLVLAELLPLNIRSTGMAFCLFANSLVSTILAYLFLPLSLKLNMGGVLLICAGFSLLYMLIAAFIVPETKQKTLEEIEASFTHEAKL